MPYITDSPIDAAAVTARVESPGFGATCTFQGVVRDHDGGQPVLRLEYECYREMAEREMDRVRAEAEARWPGCRVALSHRVGRLEIGEVAVVVAVGAGHRAASFEACRFAIDALKARVPIWKKEFRPGGSAWKQNAP